jgi:hypothetical protein
LRGIDRAFDGLIRAFSDWLSSIESSTGRLNANPTLSFLLCLFSVSISAFSVKLTQLVFSFLLTSILLFSSCGLRDLIRSLRISSLWFLFSLIIMIPRAFSSTETINGILIVPLRVATSIMTLSFLIQLLGFRRIIMGISKFIEPALGGNLGLAFEIMIIHIGRYLRSLNKLILAKASRIIEGSVYDTLSIAASELFFRGPNDAFKASLVVEARSLNVEVRNSFRDTSILVAIAFSYLAPLFLGA